MSLLNIRKAAKDIDVADIEKSRAENSPNIIKRRDQMRETNHTPEAKGTSGAGSYQLLDWLDYWFGTAGEATKFSTNNVFQHYSDVCMKYISNYNNSLDERLVEYETKLKDVAEDISMLVDSTDRDVIQQLLDKYAPSSKLQVVGRFVNESGEYADVDGESAEILYITPILTSSKRDINKYNVDEEGSKKEKAVVDAEQQNIISSILALINEGRTNLQTRLDTLTKQLYGNDFESVDKAIITTSNKNDGGLTNVLDEGVEQKINYFDADAGAYEQLIHDSQEKIDTITNGLNALANQYELDPESIRQDQYQSQYQYLEEQLQYYQNLNAYGISKLKESEKFVRTNTRVQENSIEEIEKIKELLKIIDDPKSDLEAKYDAAKYGILSLRDVPKGIEHLFSLQEESNKLKFISDDDKSKEYTEVEVDYIKERLANKLTQYVESQSKLLGLKKILHETLINQQSSINSKTQDVLDTIETFRSEFNNLLLKSDEITNISNIPFDELQNEMHNRYESVMNLNSIITPFLDDLDSFKESKEVFIQLAEGGNYDDDVLKAGYSGLQQLQDAKNMLSELPSTRWWHAVVDHPDFENNYNMDMNNFLLQTIEDFSNPDNFTNIHVIANFLEENAPKVDNAQSLDEFIKKIFLPDKTEPEHIRSEKLEKYKNQYADIMENYTGYVFSKAVFSLRKAAKVLKKISTQELLKKEFQADAITDIQIAIENGYTDDNFNIQKFNSMISYAEELPGFNGILANPALSSYKAGIKNSYEVQQTKLKETLTGKVEGKRKKDPSALLAKLDELRKELYEITKNKFEKSEDFTLSDISVADSHNKTVDTIIGSFFNPIIKSVANIIGDPNDATYTDVKDSSSYLSGVDSMIEYYASTNSTSLNAQNWIMLVTSYLDMIRKCKSSLEGCAKSDDGTFGFSSDSIQYQPKIADEVDENNISNFDTHIDIFGFTGILQSLVHQKEKLLQYNKVKDINNTEEYLTEKKNRVEKYKNLLQLSKIVFKLKYLPKNMMHLSDEESKLIESEIKLYAQQNKDY
jgi:uncharacterized protein YozE (UPF0346 family)